MDFVHFFLFLCLFNDFWHKKQAALYRGCALLVGFAIVGLTHHIRPQAQRDGLDRGDGVGQRLDASGVHGFHLLDDVEKGVERAQHALGFVAAQLKASEVGDAVNVSALEGHVGSCGMRACFATNLGAEKPRLKRAIRYYPVFGVNAQHWGTKPTKKD